jgi:hypothetical protein
MSLTEKILHIHNANELHTYLDEVWTKCIDLEIKHASSNDNFSILMSELRVKVEEVQQVILDNVRSLPSEIQT